MEENPFSTNSPSLLSAPRKRIVAMCLLVNTILVNMCFAVVGPVLPIEVHKLYPHHDATGGLSVGLIFSIATITDFLSAPLVGREMPRTGVKRTLGLGTFLVGGLMILFSFVSQLYDWTMFLGFCYAIRTCQGIGTAMIFVSTFSLLAGTFPDNVALMTGMMEVCAGLGFLVGPAVRGVLYQYGGFKAPFLLIGGMLLLGMVIIQLALPHMDVGEQNARSFPMTTVLCQPRAFMMLVVYFWNCVGWAFFDPSLGIFLHEGFQLTPAEVGASFLAAPMFYTLLSPVAGYLADNYSGKPLIPAGCFICAIGNELMGPRVIFGVKEHLAVALVGYAVIGVGSAFTAVPVSADILDTMHRKGYADGPELHSAIGAMFGAANSLGLAIGPVIGGALTNHFNLGSATASIGIFYVGLGAVVTTQTMIQWRSGKRTGPCRNNERSGLSRNSPPSDVTPLTDMLTS